LEDDFTGDSDTANAAVVDLSWGSAIRTGACGELRRVLEPDLEPEADASCLFSGTGWVTSTMRSVTIQTGVGGTMGRLSLLDVSRLGANIALVTIFGL